MMRFLPDLGTGSYFNCVIHVTQTIILYIGAGEHKCIFIPTVSKRLPGRNLYGSSKSIWLHTGRWIAVIDENWCNVAPRFDPSNKIPSSKDWRVEWQQS